MSIAQKAVGALSRFSSNSLTERVSCSMPDPSIMGSKSSAGLQPRSPAEVVALLLRLTLRPGDWLKPAIIGGASWNATQNVTELSCRCCCGVEIFTVVARRRRPRQFLLINERDLSCYCSISGNSGGIKTNDFVPVTRLAARINLQALCIDIRPCACHIFLDYQHTAAGRVLRGDKRRIIESSRCRRWLRSTGAHIRLMESMPECLFPPTF